MKTLEFFYYQDAEGCRWLLIQNIFLFAVFIFTPHSPDPILNKTCLLDPKTGVFKYCTFGAASEDDIRLYMMRNDSVSKYIILFLSD